MKETIINKATSLFLTLGFKSVTMDDIANDLGMSKKPSILILIIRQVWLKLELLIYLKKLLMELKTSRPNP